MKMDKDTFISAFLIFGSVFIIFYICTLAGCAKRVVYKDVYVPTKCDLELPQKPRLSGDLIMDMVKAMEHSEILEKDLTFCIKGK